MTSRTFDTPGPIAATVVVAGARVRVTASDRADTVVLVEPIDGSVVITIDLPAGSSRDRLVRRDRARQVPAVGCHVQEASVASTS